MTPKLSKAEKERRELEAAGRAGRGRPTSPPSREDYRLPKYAHARLLDLIAWRPDLKALAEHMGEPASPRPHATRTDGSPIEAALAQAEAIRTIYRDLQAAATTAAIALNVNYYAGDGLTWLAMNWDAIAKTELAAPMNTLIKTCHATAARLVGYGPEYADQHCPHCTVRNQDKADAQPSPRLERHATQNGLPLLYTCPVCGYAAIIDPAGWWNHDTATNTLEATWRARLAEVDAWITPADAALILNMPYPTVRWWIYKGHLPKNHEGYVNLQAAAALKTKNSHTPGEATP